MFSGKTRYTCFGPDTVWKHQNMFYFSHVLFWNTCFLWKHVTRVLGQTQLENTKTCFTFHPVLFRNIDVLTENRTGFIENITVLFVNTSIKMRNKDLSESAYDFICGKGHLLRSKKCWPWSDDCGFWSRSACFISHKHNCMLFPFCAVWSINTIINM